jgi:hypothetical protein
VPAVDARGWATCPITESGFVRVSSNPKVLPSAIGIDAARAVLSALRAVDGHRFLLDDVSLTDSDVPAISGHGQVTDGHLLTLARRRAFACSRSMRESLRYPRGATWSSSPCSETHRAVGEHPVAS